MGMLDRIENLVKAHGWSNSEFLRRVGLNPGAIRDWRANKASPEKHLSKIADVLNTTEAYLRGETDDPTPATAPTDDVQIEILARAARRMTTEEKQKLIEMAKVMFKDAFDD